MPRALPHPRLAGTLLLTALLLAAGSTAVPAAPQEALLAQAGEMAANRGTALARAVAKASLVAIVGLLGVAPLALVLASPRPRVAQSWPQLLSWAVGLAALAVLGPVGLLALEDPRPAAPLAVVGALLLAAFGLARAVRRALRWSRWVLVSLALLLLIAVAIAVATGLGGNPDRSAPTLFLPLSLLLAVPSFAVFVLLHPDVAAAFGRPSTGDSEGRRAGPRSWSRLLAVHAFWFGLGLAGLIAGLLPELRREGLGLMALSGSSVGVAAALLPPTAAYVWRGAGWARRAFATLVAVLALSVLGLFVELLGELWLAQDGLLVAAVAAPVLVFLLFVSSVVLHDDVVAAFAPAADAAAAPAPRLPPWGTALYVVLVALASW